VTFNFAGTERFDPARHDVSGFDSGNETLDRWLVRYAGQSERRDAARTFVATGDGGIVVAYYTLVVGEVEHGSATEQVRKGMSRHYPIPAALLARLAVDRHHQGRGIGAGVLSDALSRVSVAAGQVAVRAVVVHAIDENAAGFYERFGFRALSAAPRTLMVTLAELRAAGYG
jgi:GNAT superfamily N-acetyltransferase